MDTITHAKNAVIVTIILLVLIILSKVLNDPSSASNTQSAVELVQQGLKLKQIAAQDSQLFLKLQHNIMATSYIQAARYICKDTQIEKITGIDLRKLKKVIEDETRQTIANINTKCPKLKGKITSAVL